MSAILMVCLFLNNTIKIARPIAASAAATVRIKNTNTCPVDSIVETNVFEYHFENRGENIMNKQKLLEIGDRYEAQLSADKSADAPYR